MALIKPKTITVTDGEGVEKSFVISRFPATVGREIITQWPITAMPKIGDYKMNEAIMLKMMCYVAALDANGNQTLLVTRELVDNHVSDFEALAKIEKELADYNVSFFRNGRSLPSLEVSAQKALKWIIKTLTDSSAQSSQKTEQV